MFGGILSGSISSVTDIGTVHEPVPLPRRAFLRTNPQAPEEILVQSTHVVTLQPAAVHEPRRRCGGHRRARRMDARR